jgi:hypothetical protein
VAREYVIYTDTGAYYGNFHGGALLRSADFDAVNARILELYPGSILPGRCT